MNKYQLLFIILFCLTKSISQNKVQTRLGIPNFSIIANEEEKKKYNWLELGFSESLTDAFSRVSEFSVIERNQLNKIINEQQLQKSNNIDTTSIVKAGKLLGVNLILVGSCQIATNHALVNMRIVNVETGEIKSLKNLPIITPIDSILFIQKKLCIEVLNQFNVVNEKKVIEEIETVTSLSTTNIKAYEFLNKGIELFNNGQFDDAIKMYSSALTIDEKYQKAYFNRGQSNFKINNFSLAINDYKKVDNYIRKDSVYSLIGGAYNKQGNREKTIEYLTKAQKINPNNTYVIQLLNELEKNKFNFSNQQNNENSASFETIYAYSRGVARVKKNKKYGFIDVDGKVVISLIYDDLRDFKNGFAAAKLNSKWGFINDKGLLVIEAKYTDVSDFDKYKLARVFNKDKWGIIDSNGKVIIPIEFINDTFYSNWESKDFMEVAKYKGLLKLDYLYGVYNREGNNVIPIIYDGIFIETKLNENYEEVGVDIYASIDSKWGMISTRNEIIIPFTYEHRDCIRSFKNEFSAVKVNERWGFVNKKGILVIPTSFEKVNDFNGKAFEVRDKGKWGFVDLNFKQITSCVYESIEYFPEGYYKVKNNNKFGIIDLKSAKNIPCDYENIEYLSNGSYKVKYNNKYGLIDGNNIPKIELKYDGLKNIKNNYLALKKDGKWGIIDDANNLICDFKYDKINNSFQIDNKKNSFYFEVEINGKSFWIDNKCKCLYDCK